LEQSVAGFGSSDLAIPLALAGQRRKKSRNDQRYEYGKVVHLRPILEHTAGQFWPRAIFARYENEL